MSITMLISLNYAIFALALLSSFDLFRRSPEYRDAATHLLLFAFAALFGGLAHHMQLERSFTTQLFSNISQYLPSTFKISSFQYVFVRVWLITFLLIGFTEYYFMRIFLYPVAAQYQYNWVKPTLLTSLIIFSLCSIIFSQYAIVVVYHLFTHVLVIGFSLFLIFKKGFTEFWVLIALVTLNLIAGGVWSLMATDKIPTGELHYNDWYHIIILAFIVFLHWSLTKGGLIKALQSVKEPRSLDT